MPNAVKYIYIRSHACVGASAGIIRAFVVVLHVCVCVCGRGSSVFKESE